MTTEEKIERIRDFRPIDDVFFEVLAEDKEVCQEILRVIMEDDRLVVSGVIVQNSEKNIYGRSVRLDALCYLGSGKRVNIEVQRSDHDDHLRRGRFNSASITVKESNAGEKFTDVVDVCVVYISEFDIFKGNSPIYHIDRIVRETGETVDDGSYEIFVNTAVNDGSEVAELMACFSQKNVSHPRFPKLSDRVRLLKTTEGGASAVCEIMEKYMAEAAEKAAKEATEKAAKEAEKKAKEAAIKATIEDGFDFGIPREDIIKKLVSKYQLTENEAEARYDRYAPAMQ